MAYVSSSSTFTTHPCPMEKSSLQSCDLMIMSSLTNAPAANPDTMLGELCARMGQYAYRMITSLTNNITQVYNFPITQVLWNLCLWQHWTYFPYPLIIIIISIIRLSEFVVYPIIVFVLNFYVPYIFQLPLWRMEGMFSFLVFPR